MSANPLLSAAPSVDATAATDGKRHLSLAASGWFAATAIGQLLFVGFILLFYYVHVLTGNYAAWNSKPLITGYVAGDTTGNGQFAIHVLTAAVMTSAGLIQLLPAVRRKWPRLHRWSGRTFLFTAALLALGGLWLVWARGSYLTLTGGIAISLDGLLILGFGAMAWLRARQLDFAAHRRWALRTFVVASGVWFMRVGYMAWGLVTGGAGIEQGMSGPFDLVWAFATYLLPLAILELHLRAERGPLWIQLAMAVLLWACTHRFTTTLPPNAISSTDRPTSSAARPP
jgi:hypothetical protein